MGCITRSERCVVSVLSSHAGRADVAKVTMDILDDANRQNDQVCRLRESGMG